LVEYGCKARVDQGYMYVPVEQGVGGTHCML
jgi:hypothetical protein